MKIFNNIFCAVILLYNSIFAIFGSIHVSCNDCCKTKQMLCASIKQVPHSQWEYYIVTPEKDAKISIKVNDKLQCIANGNEDGVYLAEDYTYVRRNTVVSWLCCMCRKMYCKFKNKTDISHHLMANIIYADNRGSDFDIDFYLGDDKINIGVDQSTGQLVCTKSDGMEVEFFRRCWDVKTYYILLRHSDYVSPINSLESVSQYAQLLYDSAQRKLPEWQQKINRDTAYCHGPVIFEKIDVSKLFR